MIKKMKTLTSSKIVRRLFLLSVVMASVVGATAQPFIDEIRAFKKADSLQFPHAGANLFVGSSSLRMWKNIHSDLAGYPVINRGFGGSSLPDVIRYAGEIILPYKASKIFIYCGENDFAASDTVTAQTVAARFEQLFFLIRSRMKKVPIVFISIKPSPSRQHLFSKMVEANRMIREFLRSQKKTAYIDVFSLMLNADGQPRKELFIEDMLHMNAQGYAIWKKAIEPYLKK